MRSLGYFVGTFVVALMLGIGSAWYMIERGSPLTTTKVGPWDGWVSEGNPSADPYTWRTLRGAADCPSPRPLPGISWPAATAQGAALHPTANI